MTPKVQLAKERNNLTLQKLRTLLTQTVSNCATGYDLGRFMFILQPEFTKTVFFFLFRHIIVFKVKCKLFVFSAFFA